VARLEVCDLSKSQEDRPALASVQSTIRAPISFESRLTLFAARAPAAWRYWRRCAGLRRAWVRSLAATLAISLDHLIGGGEQHGWDGDA
jgi:hypothetical protein